MPSLSSARAAVIDRLADQPAPCRIAALALSLGLHENTVREHLDGLVAVGLASRELAEPDGRGRPAWLYSARHRGADHLNRPQSTAHAALAGALVAHLVETSDDAPAYAEHAGTVWGRRIASAETSPADPGASAATARTRVAVTARRHVVKVMDDLGFAPDADDQATDVRLRQCPLLELAHQNQEVVCAVHLGLVRGVLAELGGDPARTSLEPFSEPGACRLRLLTPLRRDRPV